MAKRRHFQLIGQGTYSLAEAERLTRVPRDTIRRWTRGYDYKYKGRRHHSPPIIAADAPDVDGVPALTFADLIEVRFLHAFRKYGVSIPIIRIASLRAQELLGRPRPFSTKIFKTDGRTILAELVQDTEDPVVLDLVQNQYEFKRVVDPFLYRGIDFNELEEPQRWWPMGRNRSVVIDPERAFGAPIVSNTGIHTAILAAGFKAEGSVQFVASWYRVAQQEVRDAVEFEKDLAA